MRPMITESKVRFCSMSLLGSTISIEAFYQIKPQLLIKSHKLQPNSKVMKLDESHFDVTTVTAHDIHERYDKVSEIVSQLESCLARHLQILCLVIQIASRLHFCVLLLHLKSESCCQSNPSCLCARVSNLRLQN